MAEPKVIEFTGVNDGRGGIVVAEGLPFSASRFFVREQNTYKTSFGGHAHIELEQILVCMNGRIIVDASDRARRQWLFNLRTPHCGIYVPAGIWLDLEIFFGSMLLVLCSQPYDESDYIRDRDSFHRMAA